MAERWSDTALVLRASPWNERDMMVDLLTRQHGRIRTIAKFGATSKKRALYQSGNKLQIEWSARLAMQMGQCSAESLTPYFALLSHQPQRWAMVQSSLALCLHSLYEHDRCEPVYHACDQLYQMMIDADRLDVLKQYCLFEQTLLSACGFALDLSCCAATGAVEDLTYLSPKSGRAVSKLAGEPYHNRLFILPEFYLNPLAHATEEEIRNAMAINDYFLQQRLCDERRPELPEARTRLERKLSKELGAGIDA